MKKYARLRQECSEFDNALFDATPEGSFSESQSRVPADSAGGSASPQRGDTSAAGRLTLTGALKKLGSFREVAGGSRRHTSSSTTTVPSAAGDHDGSRSARWASSDDLEDASQSGRWANAETASLSGRWGSVSTTDQFWDEAAIHSSNPKPSQPVQRQSSLRVPEVGLTINANPSDKASVQQNISMKETQGWLASVKRPRKTRSDPNEFNWRAATSTNSSSRRTQATVSQSMRYDRLKTIDLVGTDQNPGFDEGHYYDNHSNGAAGPKHVMMQKAASMREGGVHAGANIMAMARAYSEKHGVAQAIVDCVSCGRELGVIVQGNPRNVDASFCQSCRPHAVIGGWPYALSHAPADSTCGKAKRKGMMHFCKKILRMGKKPNKSKG